jgi:hypothetical protein
MDVGWCRMFSALPVFVSFSLWALSRARIADRDLADVAHTYTAGRASVAKDTSTHDVGFMIFCSFGQGVLLDGRAPEYTATILEAAASLAKRCVCVCVCVCVDVYIYVYLYVSVRAYVTVSCFSIII